MTWFSTLRLVALGRRAVRALERIADAGDSMRAMMESDWEAKHVKPKPRPVEIASFDVAAANEAWRKEQADARMERT